MAVIATPNRLLLKCVFSPGEHCFQEDLFTDNHFIYHPVGQTNHHDALLITHNVSLKIVFLKLSLLDLH